jgi:dolichol-phosphate mannosyltransferase
MSSGNREINVGISIPVLNERDNIKKTIIDIDQELEGIDYTICIVDDGSKDGTLEVISDLIRVNSRIKLLSRVKERYGCQRGAASRLALEWLFANTSSTVFVDLDADGAHSPSELMHGAKQICLLNYDVAIASKYLYGSEVIGRTVTRRFISYFYSMLARLAFDGRIRDYSNGYRFYSRRASETWLRFAPSYTSPVYLLEMLVTWIANDFRIIEIPTVYVERSDGKSGVKFIDLVKGFLGTVNIAMNYRAGHYRV